MGLDVMCWVGLDSAGWGGADVEEEEEEEEE